jgi:hypothetical protein
MNSQSHTAWPITGDESWGVATPPAIACEILPVTLVGTRLTYLRRPQDSSGAIWQVPLAGAHPSELVRAQLEAFLAHPLDPCGAVVHSTAWRYECGGSAGSRLLLTYLAALTSASFSLCPALGRQVLLEPIPVAQPARSETLMPPARIGLAQVLAHALDHLALLLETDVAIRAALGEGWCIALRRRTPRPAGELRPTRSTHGCA